MGAVVLRANDNELFQQQLLGTIDFERNLNREFFFFSENQRLENELEQVKLELKLEQQNKFATNQQKQVHATTRGVNEPRHATSSDTTVPYHAAVPLLPRALYLTPR